MKNGRWFKFILILVFAYSCTSQSKKMPPGNNLYPWCIVAFDSKDRTPEERISMLKELGLKKYAYDWRDHHLDDMANELKLAEENEIDVISVWLWLNAKRDSLHVLSPGNERMFEILKESKVKTSIWLSFSNNFFEGLSQEEALKRAIDMIRFVKSKADELACDVVLYNHKGWFGIPQNQVKIIESLPNDSLGIVFNFHHAHLYLDEFPSIVKTIKPYLRAVNLNGMKQDGPKILTLGEGNQEEEMVKTLTDAGFNGPWGILGHVGDADVRLVLEENIKGYSRIFQND